MRWRADGRTRRLCAAAVFLLASMALSWAEHLLFLLPLPLPGVRLGLANIAVLLTFELLSPAWAAGVSLARVLLSALLFGSAVSLPMSLCGAAASFAVLLLLYPLQKKAPVFSRAGGSVLCAAAHSVGQICAVCLITGSSAAFGYLGVLLVASAFTGALTGWIADLIAPRLSAALKTAP